MKIRTWISPLAVAAALSLSSAAMGQAMIGDFTIPEEDMATFTEKCNALLAASNQSLTIDSQNVEDDGDDDQVAAVDGDAEDEGEVDGVDQTTTASLEGDERTQADADPAAVDNQAELLASLTIEECRTAGLIP